MNQHSLYLHDVRLVDAADGFTCSDDFAVVEFNGSVDQAKGWVADVAGASVPGGVPGLRYLARLLPSGTYAYSSLGSSAQLMIVTRQALAPNVICHVFEYCVSESVEQRAGTSVYFLHFFTMNTRARYSSNARTTDSKAYALDGKTPSEIQAFLVQLYPGSVLTKDV
jgi:hypothetical protein